MIITLLLAIPAYADDTDNLLGWLLNLTEDSSVNDSSLSNNNNVSTENANSENTNTNTNENANTSTNEAHNVSNVDNSVYNVFAYVKWNDVYVNYVPWNGVKNVKILYSYDNVNYVPIITLSSAYKYYHFPVDFSKDKLYVKVLPVADNGVVWVMKNGTTPISNVLVSLSWKKVADKKMGYAKTGVELNLFIIFTIILAYFVYRRKTLTTK